MYKLVKKVKTMIKICEYIGGSAAYGLMTDSLVKDIRFVFKNTEISKIIGLERHDHQKIGGDDNFGYELRFFFNLLRRGNTQALESLFLDEQQFTLITEEFKEIRENKYELIDSERLFKCLMGYINGEKRVITGQNSGQLGEKRKLQLEKYGYSYRNFCHALRLLRTGIIFFSGRPYPVNIVKDDAEFGNLILSIKKGPEVYDVNYLMGVIEEQEGLLKKTFELRKRNLVFNENLANELIYYSYMPLLNRISLSSAPKI